MTPGSGGGGTGWGVWDGGARLQRGVHDLVDGGEVGVPQELGLLLESQHALRVDAADGRGNLQQEGGERWFVISSSFPPPQPPGRAALPLPSPRHPEGHPTAKDAVPPSHYDSATSSPWSRI